METEFSSFKEAWSLHGNKELVSRYQILEKIGYGAFAEVYRARRRLDDEIVALKEVNNSDSSWREVRALLLLDHPNVVKLHEYFMQGSTVVLVLEYLPSNLAHVIKVGDLTEADIKGWCVQILRGLAAVHAASIIHRDIKPANLLISEDGVLKIADFGSARVLSQDPGEDNSVGEHGGSIPISDELKSETFPLPGSASTTQPSAAEFDGKELSAGTSSPVAENCADRDLFCRNQVLDDVPVQEVQTADYRMVTDQNKTLLDSGSHSGGFEYRVTMGSWSRSESSSGETGDPILKLTGELVDKGELLPTNSKRGLRVDRLDVLNSSQVNPKPELIIDVSGGTFMRSYEDSVMRKGITKVEGDDKTECGDIPISPGADPTEDEKLWKEPPPYWTQSPECSTLNGRPNKVTVVQVEPVFCENRNLKDPGLVRETYIAGTSVSSGHFPPKVDGKGPLMELAHSGEQMVDAVGGSSLHSATSKCGGSLCNNDSEVCCTCNIGSSGDCGLAGSGKLVGASWWSMSEQAASASEVEGTRWFGAPNLRDSYMEMPPPVNAGVDNGLRETEREDKDFEEWEDVADGDAFSGEDASASDLFRGRERKIDDGAEFTTMVGTRWYRAPELLYGATQYGVELDLWAFGCIFGEMLSGKPVFPGSSEIDQLSRVVRVLGSPTEIVWEGVTLLPDWSKIRFGDDRAPLTLRHHLQNATESSLEFLQKFLTYDPKRRLSAADGIDDEYFSKDPLSTPPSSLRLPTPEEMNNPSTDDEDWGTYSEDTDSDSTSDWIYALQNQCYNGSYSGSDHPVSD